MKRVLFSALFAVLFSASLNAQTIHVINFCNTLAPGIGCDVDYERTTRETALIAGFLNYEIRYYYGKGENCSNENLMTTLNSLDCEKDDIILFYYSGHGTRSAQDKSEFPQMCLKYESYDQDKFVSVQTVIEKLQAKRARFTLIMTDCCNNTVAGISAKSLMSKDGGSITDEEKIASNYRKLFLENKGMVAVTSSKKGQTSGGGPDIGGTFSYVFFEMALYSACNGTIPATWEDILETTSDVLKSVSSQSSKISLQEPYYVMDLAQNPMQPNPSQTVSPVIAVDYSFANELSALLDSAHSPEWRLEQADYLADKYFTADAKVATVGRNGSTIIEYESARDFLHRIAVSSLIQRMNVIKETTDSTGKRNYIKVQEIRKPK